MKTQEKAEKTRGKAVAAQGKAVKLMPSYQVFDLDVDVLPATVAQAKASVFGGMAAGAQGKAVASPSLTAVSPLAVWTALPPQNPLGAG